MNTEAQQFERIEGVNVVEANNDEEWEAGQRVFEELENLGILKREGEINTFDIEKLKKLFSKKSFRNNRELGSFKRNFGDNNTALSIYRLFKGVKGVSREDFLNDIKNEKNIFYFPETAQEALDVEQIKNSDFYLSLFDVIKNIPYDKLQYGAITDLNYREVILPVLVYHQNYGDGYRDPETGILYIKNKKGEYQKFSATLFIESFSALGSSKKKSDSFYSGRKFLREKIPQILEKGLIKLTDLRVQRGQGLETEIDSKKIGTKGQVMFSQVRHLLGTQYENDIAYKISDSEGVIVQVESDGQKSIIATFNIINQDNAHITLKGYLVAGIQQTQPTEFNKEIFYEKEDSETEEKYKQRMQNFEKFNRTLLTEQYLSLELGISLEKFSGREQNMIAKMIETVGILEKNKIERFIKNYRDNGLRTFLSLEQNMEMGEKILLIGEKLKNKGKADLIFKQYAEIVDITENLREALGEYLKGKGVDVSQISNEKINKIAESILEKASGLLISVAEKLEKGGELSVEDVLLELENFNGSLLFTFAVFKELLGEVDFEDLDGVTLDRVSVKRYADLSKEIMAIGRGRYKLSDVELINDENKKERVREIYEMFEMYRDNYRGRDELLDELLGGFVEVLTGDEKTYLYLAKKDGKIVSFNRFDRVSADEKYLGSFNALLSVQGLAIAKSVFKKSITMESKGFRLVARVDPFSVSGSLCAEEGQFQVYKMIENNTGDLTWFIERVKDEERNSYYEGKDLVGEFEKQSDTVERGEVANKFVLKITGDVKEQTEYLKELINKKGFKITRYIFDKKRGEYYLGLEKE